MVITGERQDAAIFCRARSVGVFQYVAGPVNTRALAIPEGKDAIMPGTGKQANLLAAPDRCCGKVFVQAGVKLYVVAVQKPAG